MVKLQEAAQLVGQLRKEQSEESLNSQLASEGTKANDLLQSGKPADAAQIYRHMLEENPRNAQTAYNLALALEAMNDTKGAEDALRKAIDIDPKLALTRPNWAVWSWPEGDLQSAQKWLESALDLEPELVEARGNLAMVYARKGDLVSAEKLLRQADRRRSEIYGRPFEPGVDSCPAEKGIRRRAGTGQGHRADATGSRNFVDSWKS